MISPSGGLGKQRFQNNKLISRDKKSDQDKLLEVKSGEVKNREGESPTNETTSSQLSALYTTPPDSPKKSQEQIEPNQDPDNEFAHLAVDRAPMFLPGLIGFDSLSIEESSASADDNKEGVGRLQIPNKIDYPKVEVDKYDQKTILNFDDGSVCEFSESGYIAKGNFGRVCSGVYKEKADSKFRKVVVKIQDKSNHPVDVVGSEEKAIQRTVDDFYQEYDAQSQCDHPNILKVLNVGFANPANSVNAYMVLEEAEGYTVPKDANQLLKDMNHLILAVNQVHKLGFVHRDISPFNLLRIGDNLKLIDFGLARPSSQIPRVAGSVEFLPSDFSQLRVKSKGVHTKRIDWFMLGKTVEWFVAQYVFQKMDVETQCELINSTFKTNLKTEADVDKFLRDLNGKKRMQLKNVFESLSVKMAIKQNKDTIISKLIEFHKSLGNEDASDVEIEKLVVKDKFD